MELPGGVADSTTGVPIRESVGRGGPTSDDARMRELQRQHGAAVYRFLVRLSLGDPELAQDLLQETMVRAWRNLDGLPTELESERRWLFTVSRRLAIDAARARRVRPAEVGMSDTTVLRASGDEQEALVAAQTVRAALPKLSERHRKVLIEVYLLGHSTKEVSQRLGIPEGTVKSRAHYALRALRAAIGPIAGGSAQ